MARKPRDHKAEYARSKAKAQAAGYKSQREYKAVRKLLKLPPNTSPAPRRVLSASAPETLNAATTPDRHIQRLRRESKAWSDKHSRIKTSRYSPRLTDEQVIRYHAAYVEPLTGSRRQRGREKRARLYDYLVPDFLTDAEWKSVYEE